MRLFVWLSPSDEFRSTFPCRRTGLVLMESNRACESR